MDSDSVLESIRKSFPTIFWAIMIFHQVSQTGSEQEAGSLTSFLRFSLSRDLLKLCQVQAAAGLGSVGCKGFTWFHLVYHRN